MLKMKIYFTLWIFLHADGFTAFFWSDKEKIATEGATTTVTCKYDATRFKFRKKYWCMGRYRNSCDILGDTRQFVKPNYKRRLILSDNKRGTFSVTIKQMTTDDSGIYWCGIDSPYADIMTSVELKINKTPEKHKKLKTTITPSTISTSARITTAFPAKITTAFPVCTKPFISVSLPSNSTYHDVKERTWHLILWSILRWLILVILITIFVAIH